MQVKDLMTPSTVTISPDESAELAARLLARHNIGSLPVCGQDGKLRGIVTDRDIVVRCIAAEYNPAETKVREIMTRAVVTTAPDDDLLEATRLMAEDKVRRLPVVENGVLRGMLSLADLARSGRFDMEASRALSEISSNVRRV